MPTYAQPDFLGGSTTLDPGYTPIYAAHGELREDSILRLLRDQLGSSAARYGRLGTTAGATEKDLAAALIPLQEQLGRTDAASGRLRGLTGSLVNSALGSTAGAGMAAANAARLSGGGQYGGGGYAAMTAARGAVEGAVGQSAALSQALVQGQLGEAQYESGILQQRGGIAAALSQLLQQQAGLKEDRGKLGVAMDTEHAQIMASALGSYTGIRTADVQSDKTWRDKSPSLFGII